MKHHFINFLSDAGHSVSGYEHKLLEKFAAFVESFEAKQNEPAVVAHDPVAIEAPVVDTISTGNITNTEEK